MDHQTFKMSAIRGNDTIVACPYNPSHQILKSRLQTHLVKCARQNKEKEMATCAFNSTHRVPRPELSAHYKECPDRKTLDTHKFTLSDEATPAARAAIPIPSAAALPACEENWDDEVLDCTYDPSARVREMKVLRTLTGATKAERKKFRLEERRRVMELEAAEAAAAAAATSAAAAVPLPPSPRGVASPRTQSNTGFSPTQGSGGGGQKVVPGAGRAGMLRRPRAVPDAITQSLYSSRLGMGRGLPSKTSEQNVGVNKCILSDETAPTAQAPPPGSSPVVLPACKENWDAEDWDNAFEWTVAGAAKAANRKSRLEQKRRAMERKAPVCVASTTDAGYLSGSPRKGCRPPERNNASPGINPPPRQRPGRPPPSPCPPEATAPRSESAIGEHLNSGFPPLQGGSAETVAHGARRGGTQRHYRTVPEDNSQYLYSSRLGMGRGQNRRR